MAIDRCAVREATWSDVLALRGKLRESDCLEVEAATGRSADEALADSFNSSYLAWTGLHDGKPFVLFGVSAISMFSETGAPWLLGTEAIEREGIAVAKRSRQYVAEMRSRYSLLENFTDERHKSAHRWLRWCGFTMEKPAPWGVEGLPFRRFYMNGLRRG